MKAMKRHLSIFLAALMVVTCFQPGGLIQVRAENAAERSTDAVLSEETNAAISSETVNAIPGENLQINVDEAVPEQDVTLSEEIPAEEVTMLATRGEASENLATLPYDESDFFISGVNFNGLTVQGKDKLAAKNGSLDFPTILTSTGRPVSIVAKDGFKNLNITAVTFSDQIQEIGSNAFYHNQIAELVLPNSITQVGVSAFNHNQIASLKLSDSMTLIYPDTFAKNQLTEVVIPDSVKEIRIRAFDQNPGSTEYGGKVVLCVSDVTQINFYNDSADTYAIKEKQSEEYLTKDFTYVEETLYGRSFVEITGLSDSGKEKQKINHLLRIPSLFYGKEVKAIKKNAFFNSSMDETIGFTEVILPDTVERIEESAFAGNFLTSIQLPTALKEIGNYAFGFNKLTGLTVPESVKTIGQGAFSRNSFSKGSVQIDNVPGKVQVGMEAFDYITPVYLKTVPKYDIRVNAPDGIRVTVKPAQKAAEGETVRIQYEITDSTKELLSLKVKYGSYGSVKVNSDNTFVMPKSNVTIEFGLKDKYSPDKWCMEDFVIERFELGDTDDDNYINEITVKGLSSKGLEKIKKNKKLVLPEMNANGEAIESVYEEAFMNQGITELTIPDSYTKVYERAFKDNNIKKLVLSKNIVDIHKGAFENNELTEFIAPKAKFRYAGNAAFKSNQITRVVLTDHVKTVAEESFMNNQIKEVILGNKVERIASKAFANNRLEQVSIPATIKKAYYSSLNPIEKDAFDGNPGMTNPLKTSEKKVLLWTPKKNNPNKLPNGNNYVVDPVVEEKGYVSDDFSFSGGEIDGFSPKGEKKYQKLGKDVPLVLPSRDGKNKPVTGIAEYAFDGSFVEVRKLVIPEGYQTIGSMAFQDSLIDEIIVPDSIESIDELAFFNDSNHTAVIYVSSKEVQKRIGTEGNSWETKVKEPAADMQGAWKVEDFTYEDIEVDGSDDEGGAVKIPLKAVSGFSKSGMEKLKTEKELVLPKLNNKGETVEAVKENAFRANPLDPRFDSLSIPNGYRYIGDMAFAYNGFKGKLELPESIEAVGFAAFFRNEFTSVTIPSKMEVIPMSMMFGNKLTEVIFNGDVKIIGSMAFRDNKLEELTIPDSVEQILKDAFYANPGKVEYQNKLAIRTKSNKNPKNLPNQENYLINPTGGTNPGIDYNNWKHEDFVYEDQMLCGFSDKGLNKVLRNHKLIIPDTTPEGLPLLKIKYDAFRNLYGDFDIEAVTFPETIVEIEDYAFQFNSISEVRLPRDLKTLGMGVFMGSNVKKVIFNDKLEYIDQACFFNNYLGEIELPASVQSVMNAAFRRTRLTKVAFAAGSKLKVIETLAFADNKLNDISLPEGVTKIGSQAFGNDEMGSGNQFTELHVPASLKEIGYMAFINNPGVETYQNMVVIHTPDGKNPAGLMDDTGKTFVVDPTAKATSKDKETLQEVILQAKNVDQTRLTEDFKGFFKELFEEAQNIYNNSSSSSSAVLGKARDLGWAVKRAELNRLMFDKEQLDAKASTFDVEKWDHVKEAYESAKKYLMTINISAEKLQKLIYDLELALNALQGQSDLEGAAVYEGEAPIKKIQYIEPYDVKIKLWVKDGKILFIKDNGTVCDDPNEHEEHNRGYFEKAIALLHLYIGKDIETVKSSYLGSDELKIDAISGATVTSHALHHAIKDALNKADSSEPQTDTPSETNPSDTTSGSSWVGPVIEAYGNDTNVSTTEIKDEKGPLSSAVEEEKVLHIKGKKKLKISDKNIKDVLEGEYSYIEMNDSGVVLKLMPKDLQHLFKEGKGQSYLKVRKPSKAEVKKLKLSKKLKVKDIHVLQLMISGKKAVTLKNSVFISLPYRVDWKKSTVKVFLPEYNKTIKAKYNKKEKTVEFKTKNIGTFVILN